MGNGVIADRIRRFNLEYFDGRYRQELSESKRWELENTVLQQLEVTMNQDYQMKDTLIPKGAQLKGDDAYKVLFHIVQEDRHLFEDIDNPDYRTSVSDDSTSYQNKIYS